jgi:hypothetical protein
MIKTNKILSAALILTAGLLFFGFRNFPATIIQEIPHNTLEGDQISPALAYDDNAHFMLVWISVPQDDGLPGVYARLFDQNGYPVAPEFQVNTFWNPVEGPAAAGSPSGFVVVWCSLWKEGGTSGSVTARLYNPWGDPAGDEFQVNEYPWGFQGNPAAAMDAAGRFVIVWQSWEQDGDGYGVYARIFNSSGEPEGSEFQVNSTVSGDQDQPAVAAADDGSFIVIWRSFQDETGQGIISGQRFDRFGNRLGPEFQANFTTRGTAESPEIDIDAAGNFYICWHHNRLDETGYDVYVRTFDPTGRLKSQEIRANTGTSGMQVFPSLRCTSDGRFLVCWLDRPGEEISQITGRTFDRYGNPLSDEFMISSSQERLRDHPAAELISPNKLLFSWQEYDSLNGGWDLVQKMMSQPNLTFRDREKPLQRKKHATKNPIRDLADRPSNFPDR